MTEPVPRWFNAALAQAPEHLDVEVEGARVHVRVWGETGAPLLVLVHGGAAHSGWWDHVAPLLASTHRVAALDLSGHGDSAWREHYDLRQWAREVHAVAALAGGAGSVPPVVVGHSMGGWVAVTAGVDAGHLLGGVVVLDSPLNDRPPEQSRLERRRRPTFVYPTLAQALGRFSTLPPQDVLLPYVARHVAEQSLRPVEGGWTWKFDPSMYGQGRLVLRELLPDLRCRAVLIRSEFGLVTAEMAERMQELLGPHSPVLELPDAGHHAMLDQPLPLVASLRTLLTLWRHEAAA